MSEIAEETSVEAGSEETVSTEFDGNLGENWMEKYGVAENLRGDQTLQTTKHIGALASQLVNAQKMIGKTANMTIVPTEKSTQEEWSEFHKACGRPDTPDEYQITHAEGIGEIDGEVEGALKNLVHSHGLRPETVQALIDLDDQRMLGMREAMANAEVQKRADCKSALKKEWGAAYDERLHLAKRMVAENASDKNKDEVLKYIDSNPIVADFLANIASNFVEHKIMDATVSQNTPVDALAKADDLRNTPGYITGELANTSPARYNQITEEISDLTAQAYPEKK